MNDLEPLLPWVTLVLLVVILLRLALGGYRGPRS